MRYEKVNKMIDSDDSEDDDDFLSTLQTDLQNYDDWGYEVELESIQAESRQTIFQAPQENTHTLSYEMEHGFKLSEKIYMIMTVFLGVGAYLTSKSPKFKEFVKFEDSKDKQPLIWSIILA